MDNSQRQKKKRGAYRSGFAGEYFAALYLMFKGYRILNLRYKTKLGEIDIIAKRGDLIIFVEVKLRGDRDAAIAAVTSSAQRRIEGASLAWLSRNPSMAKYSRRYDIIALSAWKLSAWKMPLHIQNAF